jgi:hypothetical protein
VIAQVALDLTRNRGHGEAGELIPAGNVEAVHGLDQPQQGDLLEVLVAGAFHPPQDRGDQRPIALDQLVSYLATWAVCVV